MSENSNTEREFVCLKYKLYLNTRPDLLKQLKELKGQRLGCWCKPQQCHGDELARQADSKWIINWFSNMNKMVPMIYQGISFATVENFYQAMKVPKEDVDQRRHIAGMNPYWSKKYTKTIDIRPDWNDVKLKVMKAGLDHKFNFDPKWRYMLLQSEDWEIREWNNWGDTFWGIDIRTGIGHNNLGKLLMEVREEINGN
jgi:ribA/ribD-fused uncharacterized protein